jgi:hypothetical protein
MRIRLEGRKLKTHGTWLAATLLCLWSATAMAQFATVSGNIQTQDAVRVDATVNVIDPMTHDVKKALLAQDNGDYKIERLLPGKYDFAACGGSFVPDLHAGIELRADDTRRLAFILKSPSPTDHKGSIQAPPGFVPKGIVLYLVHRPTQCVIATATVDEKGEYLFAQVDENTLADCDVSNRRPKGVSDRAGIKNK